MASTHWESRYFLYVDVCYAGLAAIAVVAAAHWTRQRRGSTQARLVAVALTLLVLAPALVRTPLRVGELLARQPTELLPAAAWLRASTTDARVLARKPHLAYLAGREWILLPPVASLGVLATVLCQEHVTHVVWDGTTRTKRPSLAALGSGAPGVPWLTLAHASPDHRLLLYEVQPGAICLGRADGT